MVNFPSNDYKFQNELATLTEDRIYPVGVDKRNESDGIKYSTGFWGFILKIFGLAQAYTANTGTYSDKLGSANLERNRGEMKATTVYVNIADANRWIKAHDPNDSTKNITDLIGRVVHISKTMSSNL